MASSLTWLDYSERDRRRALEVIDLFRETGTVDELGLAGVRNSYSDLFFPGTSTIQTRACYFLLVPWTFQRLERLGKRSNEATVWARNEELGLNRLLRAGADTAGVFGIQAGDALKRLPSEVYWGGLRSWGIGMFPGHKWAYFRSLDGFYRRRDQFRNTPHDPEGRSAPPANWHPHIPDPPHGFPKENISVALRWEDADYLRDRIQARHPESLLALLAGRANEVDLNANRPWELIHLADSPVLRDQLLDAQFFAVCMQGAALLYNLMLSELRQRDDWIERYRSKLEVWADDVEALRPALENWELDGVWRVVTDHGRSPSYPTRDFVESWVEHLKGDGPRAIVADDSKSRTLVRDRETLRKRGRARLTNPRYLELWGGDSGSGQMAYRWGSAKRILKDIFDGLARGEGDAGNA
ncbi:DUF6361 family protein [Candidatus Palauibacter sp.]|uniref:DUF6361 family protein n=1 Tax=Candidatus Palauibacter sp. TaxID=3101350 RepID=UPI003D0CCD29